jgi:hypothetical protein
VEVLEWESRWGEGSTVIKMNFGKSMGSCVPASFCCSQETRVVMR